MRKILCDRCGVDLLQTEETYAKFKIKPMFNCEIAYGLTTQDFAGTYHLCYDCTSALVREFLTYREGQDNR